jgi:membrane-bound ClpP family serine protease
MNITSSGIQRAWAVIRQLAGYASIVLGAIPATSLPNAVRAPLIVFGAVLIAIEHYVADPSTGSTAVASSVVKSTVMPTPVPTSTWQVPMTPMPVPTVPPTA